MAVLTVIIGVVLGLCMLSTALLKWNEIKYRKKGLPPGTMGWPLFGETTDFLKQGPTFMKNQRARKANIFFHLENMLHFSFTLGVFVISLVSVS
uniref:Putative cytochrome P450 n=1 Tax=Helianthus annuus TaxID=4232 RepID=A0A251S6M4_HELAN